MEAALAIPAMLSTGAAAVGTGAAAVGSGLSAAFAGSSAMTLLQGGSTLVSMLGSLSAGSSAEGQGAAQAMATRFAAEQQRLETQLGVQSGRIEASQEYLVGQAKVLALRRKLADDIGANIVAYAASGVDPTSGSAAARAGALVDTARSDIKMEKANAEIRRQQVMLKISALRRGSTGDIFGMNSQADAALAAGQSAKGSSMVQALGTGLNFGMDVLKRGGPGFGAGADAGLGSWAATVTRV